MSVTFTSTYGSVTLPNPVLGDSDQVLLNTDIKMSMSGTIRTSRLTFADITNSRRFLLNFVRVTGDKIAEFLDWFENSRDLAHTYTDYNSTAWVGTIMNDPIEVTFNGKFRGHGAGCSVTDKELGSFTVEFVKS